MFLGAADYLFKQSVNVFEMIIYTKNIKHHFLKKYVTIICFRCKNIPDEKKQKKDPNR